MYFFPSLSPSGAPRRAAGRTAASVCRNVFSENGEHAPRPLSRLLARGLLLCLLLSLPAALGAQTIIELKPGGSVRAKTVDDYKEEMQMAERLRDDSLAYVDNLRRAFNALHADSLAQAETLFAQALKLRPAAPGNRIIHYNLGLIDLARGREAQAVAKLTALLKDYPNYAEARLARAEANLQLGKAAEAVSDAQTLLDYARDKAVEPALLERARFVRAAARYHLRLYAEAHADLQAILRDAPQNENAQILDALTLQQLGQPREALNRLNLIVAARPESTDALSARAAVEMELGLNVLARADYDELLRLHPDESGYYVERARVLLRLDEKTAARRDLDRAVSLGVPRGMVQALYNLTR